MFAKMADTKTPDVVAVITKAGWLVMRGPNDTHKLFSGKGVVIEGIKPLSEFATVKGNIPVYEGDTVTLQF